MKVARVVLKINGKEYDAYGIIEDNGDYVAFEAEKIIPKKNGRL